MSAFHHSAGSVLWGRHPLSPREIDLLGDLFAAEIMRACDAKDPEGAGRAVCLARDLVNALTARADWRRAACIRIH